MRLAEVVNDEEFYSLPKRSLLLLLATMLACPLPAFADTVTIGWWDKSIGGPVTALSATWPDHSGQPIVDVIQHPLLLGSGFGFAQVVAMVIPPTGNILSGGLGGAGPTFQFSFNNGFAPPQGGNIRLYATWQGALTSGGSTTLPSRFATNEMPSGISGFTVAEQVFICGGGGLFCDNYVTGGGTLIAQDNFHDALRVDTMTLTSFAPGQPFSITESLRLHAGSRDFSVRAAGQRRCDHHDHSRGRCGATTRNGVGTRSYRRCWLARPDFGERWPSRLVAMAAADCVSATIWSD
jgi:hypothetical protein